MTVVAGGTEYRETWNRFSLPSWERFAERHGYGIAVLAESQLKPDVALGWNKFLLPALVQEHFGQVDVALVLDADQVFSPLAPPVDLSCSANAFGLVHVQDWSNLTPRRLISFLRRLRMDPTFPLDSSLLLSDEDWTSGRVLDLHGHPLVSSGFMLVPGSLSSQFADLARFVADPASEWDGGGGDQTIASRELQDFDHYFLDQRWQGLWPLVMSDRYATLYLDYPVHQQVAADALVSAMMSIWCIHFSTSWPEKQFWSVDWMSRWDELVPRHAADELSEYLQAEVQPRDYGRLPAPEVRLLD